MKQVALFFTWRAFGAGTTTFTAHLAKGFEAIGVQPFIYRVKARGEEFTRSFSQYHGLRYQNLSCEGALQTARTTPSLLCSPCPAKHLPEPDILHKLIKAGMKVVIHGLVDKRVHEKLGTWDIMPHPIYVRPGLGRFGRFIPHPYVRVKGLELSGTRRRYAISIARTTFIKNTAMIVEANAMLPHTKRVILLGTVDRMYVQHKIKKQFPDFDQVYKGFPAGWDFGAMACNDAVYAVDMSDGVTNGGGGTQYTFLEAWDGGAINVINRNWITDYGCMEEGHNCLAVDTPKELVRLLLRRDPEREAEIIGNGRRMLHEHDPARVAKQYWEQVNK